MGIHGIFLSSQFEGGVLNDMSITTASLACDVMARITLSRGRGGSSRSSSSQCFITITTLSQVSYSKKCSAFAVLYTLKTLKIYLNTIQEK